MRRDLNIVKRNEEWENCKPWSIRKTQIERYGGSFLYCRYYYVTIKKDWHPTSQGGDLNMYAGWITNRPQNLPATPKGPGKAFPAKTLTVWQAKNRGQLGGEWGSEIDGLDFKFRIGLLYFTI